jgi:hypothetical protein
MLMKSLRLVALTALFLLICVCSTFAQSGNGAINVVQSLTAGLSTDAGTNPTGTYPGAQTAGNSNVVMVEYCGTGSICGTPLPSPITSVTDSTGNTYSRVCGPLTNISSGSYTGPCGGGTFTIDGNNTIFEAWIANNIAAAAAGANTFTMHMTSTANMKGWNTWYAEVHIATAGSILVLDQAVTTTTLSVNPATGMGTGTTPTTTAPNEIFFAWCLPVAGLCQPAPSGWTEIPLNGGIDFDTHSDAAYKIATSQQTSSAFFGLGSIGAGDEAIAGILTFRSVSPGPNRPNPPTSLTATVQ